MKASHALRSGSLQAWPVALRPRSLLVDVSPVLVQVIPNMQNDVGHMTGGGDRSVTRTGLIVETLAAPEVLGPVALAGFDITLSTPLVLRERSEADIAAYRPLVDEGRIARV